MIRSTKTFFSCNEIVINACLTQHPNHLNDVVLLAIRLSVGQSHYDLHGVISLLSTPKMSRSPCAATGTTKNYS